MGIDEEIDNDQKTIDVRWAEIMVLEERDTINHYAQEIGFWGGWLEARKDDEILSQWFKYFLSIAQSELEGAHERLKGQRAKLTS